MSTHTNTPTDTESKTKSEDPLEDIPVEGTDSILEVIRDPNRLREWLENLKEETSLDKAREVSGHKGAHTIGENVIRGMEMTPIGKLLYRLEKTPDTIDEEPPHNIIRNPRSLLDNLIHISGQDKWLLRYPNENDLNKLPRSRRKVFEYLLDPETSVDRSDLEAVGGTDMLIWGPMGRGKTTVVQTLVARLMEASRDTIVWRGTGQRTEWLPFAPWTIVALPEGINYEVTIAPPEEGSGFSSSGFDPVVVDLEDIVWRVERYSDINDLNKRVLQPGAFHVVYPDPYHRGAQKATERAEESNTLNYVSAADATEDKPATPPMMWWFAWLIHQNTFGRSMRVTWVCDEASNVFPDHASNDEHNHEKRIGAASSNYVDFRRNGLTFILLSQRAEEIAWQIRKKMRWGVPLSGTSNPVTEEVIGAGTPPMNQDLTTGWNIGKGIVYTAGSYTEFDWDRIPDRYKVPGKLRVRAVGVGK